MAKLQKDKLRWLLLPIETKARELDANILLACFAAEAGYGVIMGQNIYLDDLLEYLPRGIYLAKGMSTSKSQSRIIKHIKELGYEYTCLDEEGLVYEKEAYFRYRASLQNLEEVKVFFAWGKKHATNILEKFPQFANKIVITGNPRVDLWRPELREYFNDKVAKIRMNYGPYILIASNFASANFFHKFDFVLNQRKKEGTVRSFEDEEYLKERYHYKLKLFKKFLELIRILSKTFPNHKIIIRPHPAEKHEVWEKTAERLSNVKVIYEGSATPWILGADVLIHNSCTTGIEAFLLDKPVFSYRPYTSQRFDSYLPIAVSHNVFNTDSLVKLLKEAILNRNYQSFKDKKRIRSILAEHIASLDGIFASEMIVNALAKIDIKKQLLFNNKIEQFLLTKHKIKRFIKEAIKVVLLSTPKPIRLFLPEERLNAWQNQRKRFPLTTLSEIQQSIEKFSTILHRFEKIKVFEIAKNCFCIIMKV